MLCTDLQLKGTVPFMSAEVMLGKHTLVHSCHKQSPSTFAHQAVHDIESFFWILMYICLTRKGPDGARRDELDHQDDPSDYTEELRGIIYCLFGCDWRRVIQKKTAVLEDRRNLEDIILPYFHPYFDGLKDLIRKWHGLLYHAYSFRLIEYDIIHDQSLKLIQEALASLEQKAKKRHQLMKVESDQRNVETACSNPLIGAEADIPPSPDLQDDPSLNRHDSTGELDVMLGVHQPTSPERPAKKQRLE